MRKPIIIGLIAVITIILVTNVVDFSVTSAKPTNEIYAEGRSLDNGEIVCPDGNTKLTSKIAVSFYFNEDETRNKGEFSAFDQDVNPQSSVRSDLWSGSIDSGSYMFKGVGNENFQLADVCGTDVREHDEYTVWGKCGDDVVINFETDSGISGSFIGKVVCI